MTPLWRAEMRKYLRHPQHRLTTQLANARTFDLRSVDGLVASTAKDLCQGSELKGPGDGDGILVVDIGERTCIPAPSTWLEFDHEALWIRDLIGGSDRNKSAHMAELLAYADGKFLNVGALALQRGRAIIMPKGPDGKTILEKDNPITRALFCTLSALAVINSPAAERTPGPVHRGLDRDIRRAFQRPASSEIAHTQVTIRFGTLAGAGDARDSHPKAYHFCRAHARLKNGKVEQVRAHWRGDPAFGYRLPSYSVKAPASARIEGDET
jgi:hypothetical protein